MSTQASIQSFNFFLADKQQKSHNIPSPDFTDEAWDTIDTIIRRIQADFTVTANCNPKASSKVLKE